ncbi:2-succinyl-6-hydroxy-2,4-cyclohexadiene-1-carboxylate synthase [Shewanella maritima]|uniref:2-succinyl-6-hydroxy-2, 4-cyclohexadiene-1-carboxylate synthase n=1 Tax=Shewanella maritima TaxID=2520507 RepID=UPI003736E8D5
MIKVSRFGDPSLPPLVLLHGFMGAKEDWQPLMPKLSQVFHCICVDLPGHGQSEWLLPSPGLNEAAHAIVSLLSNLGHKQFHLLGYSLGGRIALHIAQQHPQKLLSLTLESAHPGLQSEPLKQARLQADNIWLQRLETIPLVEFLTLWYQQPVFADLTKQQQAALIKLRSNNQADALLNCYQTTSLALQQDLRKIPDSLGCITNVMVGQQDKKFSALAKKWAQDTPINLIEVADAGHNIHSIEPNTFTTLLFQHLPIAGQSKDD